MMWMGTTTGTLKVFHAPTLKAKFTGKLTIGPQKPSCILDILHIESLSCVLVSTTAGDIWSFHDSLTAHGLIKQCRLPLTDNYQCYHLVAVESQGSVEIWGTLDNSQLCLLEKDGAGWKSQEIKVKTGDPKLRLCSHIALAQFKDKRGASQSHLWISFRSRGVLVSLDAALRQQRCVINCNSFQQLKDSECLHMYICLGLRPPLFTSPRRRRCNLVCRLSLLPCGSNVKNDCVEERGPRDKTTYVYMEGDTSVKPSVQYNVCDLCYAHQILFIHTKNSLPLQTKTAPSKLVRWQHMAGKCFSAQTTVLWELWTLRATSYCAPFAGTKAKFEHF